MEWRDHKDGVLTMIQDVELRSRKTTIALRVDARFPERGIRVDLKTATILPWEAIDEGLGFTEVADAKAYAERWLEKVREKKTLEVRNVRSR